MSHHSDFEAWQGPSTDTRIKNLEASNRILRKAAYEAEVKYDKASRRLWAGIIGTAVICGVLSALGVM